MDRPRLSIERVPRPFCCLWVYCSSVGGTEVITLVLALLHMAETLFWDIGIGITRQQVDDCDERAACRGKTPQFHIGREMCKRSSTCGGSAHPQRVCAAVWKFDLCGEKQIAAYDLGDLREVLCCWVSASDQKSWLLVKIKLTNITNAWRSLTHTHTHRDLFLSLTHKLHPHLTLTIRTAAASF